MSIGWFDGEIKPASWFHPIAAGGIFDETLIAQSGGSGAITGTLESADAADGFAASGLLAHVGALFASDSLDNAALTGGLAHIGAISATDGADSVVMAGILGHVGSILASESADAVAMYGVVPYSQAAAVGGGHSKSKAVYVKRGENIMVFRDADAADAWLTNEKEAEKAHKHGKPYRPRKPKPLDAKSWQALEIPKIANLASRFKEQEAFTRHLAAENWEALAVIYDHLRQREEEEILAVLLAA